MAHREKSLLLAEYLGIRCIHSDVTVAPFAGDSRWSYRGRRDACTETVHGPALLIIGNIVIPFSGFLPSVRECRQSQRSFRQAEISFFFSRRSSNQPQPVLSVSQILNLYYSRDSEILKKQMLKSCQVFVGLWYMDVQINEIYTDHK